jgi:hypothetical protein
MKLYKICRYIIWSLACLVLVQATCKKGGNCMGAGCDCADSACNPKSFTLFNAMHYNQTPDLSTSGVHNFYLVYPNHLIHPDPNNQSDLIPYPDSIQALAARLLGLSSIPVSFDIESWSYSSSQLPTTISNLLQVMDIFRQVNPVSKIGYYGVVPNDAYTWQNIQPAGSAKYIKWQQLNAALTPIADSVDYFFPSFYTFDNDTASWRALVNATLDETHRYSRSIPIYAYVWPQYHDGQPNQLEFVDTTVWRYELETLYNLADGIVIWSSNKGPNGSVLAWDESQPWWQVTQSFIREHGIQ